MNKNMGTIDRVVRSLMAVIIVVLYFTGNITGIAALVLGIFAVAFLVTSFLGFCPAYLPFNLKTFKE